MVARGGQVEQRQGFVEPRLPPENGRQAERGLGLAPPVAVLGRDRQRGAVVGFRLGVRVRRLRLVPGPQGIWERPLGFARPDQVIGHLGGLSFALGPPLQRVGDSSMQRDAARAAQVGEHHLADQVVGELVVAALRDKQSRAGGGLARSEHGGL
jgi:hypothetical protein